tara:strand:+ start:1882 stop:2199 length:318 start_codon:yes stop_codon:yes gene_type:complete
MKVLRCSKYYARPENNLERRVIKNVETITELRSESLQAWGYRIKSDITRKASSNIVVDLTVLEESLTHFLSTLQKIRSIRFKARVDVLRLFLITKKNPKTWQIKQ